MATIKAITKYKFKGVEYNSLLEVQNKIHDIIGLEVLDKIQRVCPLEKHKDYLKLLDLLCSKEVRTVLTDVLNVTFEVEGETTEQDEEINILDYNKNVHN